MNESTNDKTRSAPMKILVLGPTGGTGRLIVSQALAQGHEVSVLVRSADKAAGLQGVKVIVGDARDESALRQAVKGRDAIISALGTPASPFREVTLLSTATRAPARDEGGAGLTPDLHYRHRRRR